jgi:hypothetical protein
MLTGGSLRWIEAAVLRFGIVQTLPDSECGIDNPTVDAQDWERHL